MKLDWMMFANYAEAPGGTVNMLGAGWDTVNVTGPFQPPPGSPPQWAGAVALLQGALAARVVFHQTEVGRDRQLRIVIVDEDGGEIGKIEGGFRAEKQPGLPPGWEQGVNMVFPLAGLPLPKFGLYRVSLLVDDQHLGDREFRVLKLF